MRLTEILLRNARQPQNVNKVPFKAITPLKLKDRISSKNQIVTDRGCLYEISMLLTCLEENNFEDKNCIPQVKKLDECYKNYTRNMQRQNIQHEQVVPVPNSKNITHKQATYLLRKYPMI